MTLTPQVPHKLPTNTVEVLQELRRGTVEVPNHPGRKYLMMDKGKELLDNL